MVEAEKFLASPIAMTETSRDAAGRVMESRGISTYKIRDGITRELVTDYPDGLQSKIIYEISPEDYLLSLTSSNNGAPSDINTTKYILDSNHRRTGFLSDTSGITSTEGICKYNGKEVVEIDINEILVSFQIFKEKAIVDNLGRIIQVEEYPSYRVPDKAKLDAIPTSNPEKIWKFDYNSLGKPTSVKLLEFLNGQANQRAEITLHYNENSLLDSEIERWYEDSKLSEVYRNQYIYDKYGNWVTKYIVLEDANGKKLDSSSIFRTFIYKP